MWLLEASQASPGYFQATERLPLAESSAEATQRLLVGPATVGYYQATHRLLHSYSPVSSSRSSNHVVAVPVA
jgi:hypothetical protein